MQAKPAQNCGVGFCLSELTLGVGFAYAPFFCSLQLPLT